MVLINNRCFLKFYIFLIFNYYILILFYYNILQFLIINYIDIFNLTNTAFNQFLPRILKFSLIIVSLTFNFKIISIFLFQIFIYLFVYLNISFIYLNIPIIIIFNLFLIYIKVLYIILFKSKLKKNKLSNLTRSADINTSFNFFFF